MEQHDWERGQATLEETGLLRRTCQQSNRTETKKNKTQKRHAPLESPSSLFGLADMESSGPGTGTGVTYFFVSKGSLPSQ